MVWAKVDGKHIPLDPRWPTYFEFIDPDGNRIWRKSTAMISHFITCPKRNEFSSSNKKKEQENLL